MAISLGIIGFGEVGGIFSRGLKEKANIDGVYVWDTLFAHDTAEGEKARKTADSLGVHRASAMTELCSNATLMISAVTASNDLEVAKEAARNARAGAILVDFNSASPGTKQLAAAEIEGAGAHYVEAGVMTSVPPYGIRVPMLLGGPKADEVADIFNDWGMDAKVVSQQIGIASAIKMSRSIMIKGMEALVIEAYTNARAYGVENYVLPTLQETFPQIDWSLQGAYFFSRVVQHGRRRAEEMRESANTVREGGFAPLMTDATALKQDWLAGLARDGVFDGMAKNAPWQDYADRLIKQVKKQ